MVRVPNEELLNALLRVLLKLGFTEERGRRCAQLFVETTRDGIYSHGLNRFPRFVRTIQNGLVEVQAQPKFVQSHGSLERWNGNSGPGNLNAWQSMERAIALSRDNGIGCVALANTPLVAWRDLWLASRRCRRDRDLLDKHSAQPSAMGRQ